MFPKRYFAPRYFAPRYFSGESIAAGIAHYIYVVSAESRVVVIPFEIEEPRIYEVPHD